MIKEWTSIATISIQEPIKGYPFANIFSMSDGPIDSSTGVPYMYLMPLELSAIDLSHNEKASLTMTMAQVADVCISLYISTDATLRASTARRTTTTSRTRAVLTSSSPATSSSWTRPPARASSPRKLCSPDIPSCRTGRRAITGSLPSWTSRTSSYWTISEEQSLFLSRNTSKLRSDTQSEKLSEFVVKPI